MSQVEIQGLHLLSHLKQLTCYKEYMKEQFLALHLKEHRTEIPQWKAFKKWTLNYHSLPTWVPRLQRKEGNPDGALGSSWVKKMELGIQESQGSRTSQVSWRREVERKRWCSASQVCRLAGNYLKTGKVPHKRAHLEKEADHSPMTQSRKPHDLPDI